MKKIFTPSGCGRMPCLLPLKHLTLFYIMRLGLLYLFIMTGSMQPLMANESISQGLDEIDVTLELKDADLKEVFRQIQDQSGLLFAYPSQEVQNYKGFNLSKATRSVKATLDEVLRHTPFDYRLINKSIIISIRETPDVDTLSYRNRVHVQEVITGKVTDQKGTPLPGVNVLIKGTANGVVTDIDGNFRIDASEDDVLIFSFIGFTTLEEPLNGRSSVTIQLQEDISQLEAVEINAGYYTVKDEVKTGNIARITSSEIEKQPVANPLQAMQGRMAGVQITQRTGVAGGGFDIRIRGQNSLRTEANAPLYVIDGVPYTSSSLNSPLLSGVIANGSPLSAINPADIQSIEVLKDADATAIYGSRGANGVVLITTKRSKRGKEAVNVNIYKGFGRVAHKMDLLNTSQYLEMRREAFANDEVVPSGIGAKDLLQWDTTRYTDWQKELIGGTARITNAQASVSGGHANTFFLLGGGYYEESSVFPGDGRNKKGSALFNLNHTADDQRLNINMSVNYVTENNNLQNRDLTREAIELPPNAPSLYDKNGHLNWENSTWTNPLAYLEKKYKAETDNLISNLTFGYHIIPGLNISARMGYNLLRIEEISTNPISSINPALTSATGTVTFANNQLRTWIAEPQAEWSLPLTNGELKILIGTTFQENVQEGQAIGATGYTNDALLENIRAATNTVVRGTNFSEYKYNALFARINYVHANKYLLNLTGRRDGSSRFGPGKQFASFGAAGVAWIFSNEQLLQNANILSFGKIRMSYGITGSDQIGDYQYLNSYSPTTYPYNGTMGLLVSRLPNPDYSWETNKKFESALELASFKDRIALNSSWYHNTSSNQLVGYPLPVITGQTSIQYNLPAKVVNSGWEFELQSSNVQASNFSWNSSLNLTIPTNELVNYPDIEASAYVNTYKEGESLNIQKKYAVEGVDPETGMFAFQDVNEDDALSILEDGQFLKEVGQMYYGGFQNTFRYKSFQLDFFFQFVKQTGWNYRALSLLPGSLSNQPTIVLDRWQQEGDQTDVQAFSQSYGSPIGQAYVNSTYFGDNAIGDASFIRLKNVSFSYSIPTRWIDPIKMDNAKIYFQGQNLWTFTKYLGLDPETQSIKSLPPLSVVTFGFQCSF